MDFFFDTCVIIKYASYDPNAQNLLNSKCFEYIRNKKGKYILCYYVLDELRNNIKKRALIYRVALKKIFNPNYLMGDFGVLSRQDVAFANKLFESYKSKDIEKVSEIFFEEKNNFQRKIDNFIKILSNEKVIPIEMIDKEIVSVLKSFIEKHSDCLVLASAIQEQQKRETFSFVTCDDHFNPNNYEFINEDPKLGKCKFPELKNLLYEDSKKGLLLVEQLLYFINI